MSIVWVTLEPVFGVHYTANLSHHLEAFGVNAETLLQRTDQPAFRAAAYLLRLVVNLSLKEVAALFSVSPARISRIQREVEQDDLDSRLAGLLEQYKVKN